MLYYNMTMEIYDILFLAIKIKNKSRIRSFNKSYFPLFKLELIKDI